MVICHRFIRAPRAVLLVIALWLILGPQNGPAKARASQVPGNAVAVITDYELPPRTLSRLGRSHFFVRETLAEQLLNHDGEKPSGHSRPRSIRAGAGPWRQQIGVGPDADMVHADRIHNHSDVRHEVFRRAPSFRPYANDSTRVRHGCGILSGDRPGSHAGVRVCPSLQA